MRPYPEQSDVIIVGAGPAGAAAATRLARLGRNVVAIDKATFPRDKTCGDGLTTSALRELEDLGHDPTTLESWRAIMVADWRSPSGRSIETPLPTDGIRIGVAERSELDASLVETARSAGAEVREATALVGLRVEGEKVTAELDSGNTISAAYLLAADGMWSPTRKALSASRTSYLGDLHAFRQYFSDISGSARDRMFVSFEPELLPGYFWAFPVGNNRANVGIGAPRHAGQSVGWMNAAWHEILQRPHIRNALGEHAVPDGSRKAWPIPTRSSRDLLTSGNGRILFLGDAARLVDPLTGEGIGQALYSARLASNVIERAGSNRPGEAGRRYSTTIQQGLLVDNAFARFLARIVSTEFGARAVIRLSPYTGSYGTCWVFEDNPRAGLLTPWRWNERFRPKVAPFAQYATSLS